MRSNIRGSTLLLVIIFMMIFSLIGLATIKSSCYQEIQVNAEMDAYRANLLADAGLEWGKMLLAQDINNNIFPENKGGCAGPFCVETTVQNAGSTHGSFFAGVYVPAGNNIVWSNILQSSSGTYIISSTATVTSGIVGSLDTEVCKSIAVCIQRSSCCVLTNPMQWARIGHTATLLTVGPNAGKVLITGGTDGLAAMHYTGVWRSAELYDPVTNTFSPTGSMGTARHHHTATLLNDGSVLITGGMNAMATGVLASAELYDPNSGTFSPAGNMSVARCEHTATLLGSGNVLITGGLDDLFVSTNAVDLYNGTFYSTTSVAVANGIEDFTATYLPATGNVLIAGGLIEPGVNSTFATQVYNAGTASFGPVTNMLFSRDNQVAIMLNTGKVLICGGMTTVTMSDTLLASAELYDPGVNSFGPTGSMTTPRIGHTCTFLPYNNKVLTAGYAFDLTMELYDPTFGVFSTAGTMVISRYYQQAVMMNNGVVLFTGGMSGMDDSGLSSAELYGTLKGNYIAGSYYESPTRRVVH